MDLDVESLGSGENQKKLMIGGALLAVVIIVLLAATQLTPRAINASFTQNPVMLTQKPDTNLIVSLQNLEKTDIYNVNVTVKPESNKVTVTPSSTIETIMGAGARRDLTFSVLAQSDATPGSYLIRITAGMNEKTVETDVYLEVKK